MLFKFKTIEISFSAPILSSNRMVSAYRTSQFTLGQIKQKQLLSKNVANFFFWTTSKTKAIIMLDKVHFISELNY